MPSRLREESMSADRGAGPLRVGEEARDDGAEGVVKPLGIQREGMLLYIYISDFKSRWKLRGRQLSDRVYRRPEFEPKDQSKQTVSYGRNVVGR